MKRKIVILLIGAMMMSVSGCGIDKSEKENIITNTENVIDTENSETEEDNNIEDGSQAEENNNIEEGGETEENNNIGENSQTEENNNVKENNAEEKVDDSLAQDADATEDTFSFAEFKNVNFLFASGTGAWSTEMTINADGSFSGVYHDSNMGDTGEGYPNGSLYISDFSGRFTQPEKVNDYTYSMQIQEISYADKAGTEEILDGTLCYYSDAYGLTGAKNILIYLPGAPLEELPEEFRTWVGYYDLSTTEDTELPFYGLYNEAEQCGFSSNGYDLVESVKEWIASTEADTAEIEESIETDMLTQIEYNEKTKQLYESWDLALNKVWEALQNILDEDDMASLTIKERDWVNAKEQAVKEAGAEFEGGSMQPMVMNQKGAEMTKERVYELMEILVNNAE